MSVFKNHKTVADRSASDRRRHKEKIEKAIKEGIHDIVAEESIIGQDGKKKIKRENTGNINTNFVTVDINFGQFHNFKKISLQKSIILKPFFTQWCCL